MKNNFLLIGTIIISIFVLSFTACPSGGGGGGVLNHTALDTALSNANAEKTGVQVSTDGSNVSTESKWVTQSVLDTFNSAITAAQAIRTGATTQAQLNDAVTALNIAVTTFINAKQNGTMSIDTTVLQELITQANTLKDTAVVSTNGSEVSSSNYWVTQAEMDALTNAISTAEAAATGGENFSSAYSALSTAMSVFTAAKKAGTQGGSDPVITYNVTQIGGVSGSSTTTGLQFTFSASIDSLNVTAVDISMSGAATKGAATFTGSGTSWTLSTVTVNEAGTANVSISKSGIETNSKNVDVFKAGQDGTEVDIDIEFGDPTVKLFLDGTLLTEGGSTVIDTAEEGTFTISIASGSYTNVKWYINDNIVSQGVSNTSIVLPKRIENILFVTVEAVTADGMNTGSHVFIVE